MSKRIKLYNELVDVLKQGCKANMDNVEELLMNIAEPWIKSVAKKNGYTPEAIKQELKRLLHNHRYAEYNELLANIVVR